MSPKHNFLYLKYENIVIKMPYNNIDIIDQCRIRQNVPNILYKYTIICYHNYYIDIGNIVYKL